MITAATATMPTIYQLIIDRRSLLVYIICTLVPTQTLRIRFAALVHSGTRGSEIFVFVYFIENCVRSEENNQPLHIYRNTNTRAVD